MKQLVLVSYSDGVLDKKKVDKITKLLNRKSLKQYIKTIKSYEREHSVFIEVAHEMEAGVLAFEELFQNKKIVYHTDPTLLFGVKVTDNDLVYEMSLKSRFDEILEKIKQNYD